MKKALRTEWIREIRYSLPRFLSILFLVALGVAFFAGIRATEPDMRETVDRQYDDENFMDLRVLSTQGLTDKDVEAVSKTEGVQKAEGTYTKDVLCDIGQSEVAIKVYAKTDSLNQMHMEEGRDLKKSGECLVDARFAQENKVKIGDTITLKSGSEDEDLKDSLKKTTYKIVGLVNYNYYLTRDRGTTTIGNGKIEGFLVIPKDDFDMDVYTEIAVSIKGGKKLTTYTDAYEDKVESVVDNLEEIKGTREQIRYEEIKKEANDKIEDSEKEYRKEKKKAQNELKKAKDKLDQAKNELTQAENELAQAKAELDSGEKQLASGRKQYENGIAQLKSGKQQYEDGLTQYRQGVKDYEKQEQQLSQAKEALDQAIAAYGITYDQLDENYGELYQQYLQYLEGKKQLEAGKAKLDKTKSTLDATKKKLDASETKLQNTKSRLEASKTKLAQGRKEYEAGLTQLKSGRKEYQKGLAKYQKEKKKAEQEFKKAEQKIQDAKDEVKKLKKGKWYLLDRNKIQSYVEFGQDSERIGAIGKVFPFIFFLVAAMVSLTTMTRMVEKERTQLGTMKALGYSKLQIAGKYLIYAALATILGSMLGAAAGEFILPHIIITAYCMMYVGIRQVVVPFHIDLALLAATAAFVTTLGATMLSSYRALMEVPAQLMRPEAPKEGKRVLLERIPFIWKRISFSWKSSIRNLLRYKKRFFMTIFGISGCMALLLVGFGLEDSIFAITNNQYTKIRVYDAIVGFDEEDEDLKEHMDQVLSEKEVTSGIRARETSVDVETEEGSKTGDVIVPEDKKEIEKYIKFKDRTTGKSYHMSDDGVIITEKLAKILNIEVGDTIWLKEGETKKKAVKVMAIAENYMMNYVFMSDSLYQSLYKKAPVYNQVFVNTLKHTSSFEDALSKKLLKMEGVTSVSYVSSAQEEMGEMLGNLNIVVFVLIAAAGLLAFVVLYNLNNINIEERRRELATIKVLGFYQPELAAYVYRENVLLTIIGIVIGIFFGMILHQYVILTAEVDAIMFGRTISTQSYVYSILLTIFFAVFVNGVMYFKLKKIDMVESLKSVE